MRLRLGICEDDPFTLSTLSASLAGQDVQISFSCASAADVLEVFEKKRPHAVLIDLHLGKGPTGLDLSRQLRAIDPKIGMVFLTSFESPKLLDSSFKTFPHGAQYLNKQDITSIEQILHAAQDSISKSRKSAQAKSDGISTLTSRQLEVLKLLAEGLSNKEIGKRLTLSPKTVEGVIIRIGKKLDLRANPDSNQRIQMARAYLRGIGHLSD